MTSTDTTPLLGGPNTNTNINTNNNNNNNNNQRHWSEETEDISTGPDPDSQNSGPGYRRRGGAGAGGGGRLHASESSYPYSYSSDLDGQRFSGQNRRTGLRRVLCGCCCLPCRRAYAHLQNNYSKTEKYAMGLALLFFCSAAIFLMAFVRALDAIPDSSKNGICTSRECGGFMDRVSIPDDKAQIGYFNLVDKENQEVIKSILTPETSNVQRVKDDARKRNLVKLQLLYESCMNEKNMSDVGAKPLADLVQTLTETFPVKTSVLRADTSPSVLKNNLKVLKKVNKRKASVSHGMQNIPYLMVDANTDNEAKWLDEDLSAEEYFETRVVMDTISSETVTGAGKEELASAISQLAFVGVSTMVRINVDVDPKNPDANVLFLGESGLGLPSKEYYDEEKIVATYQKIVEEMFVIVMEKDKVKDKNNNNEANTTWAEVAKNVVEFEKNLAGISSNHEGLGNSELNYNPRSLSQIAELIPTIDWSLMLEKLLGKGFKVPDSIIVSMPDYFEKLNTLLGDTPALTLQNYFAWRLVRNLSPNLAVELQKPMQQLKAALRGVSADLVAPRWETCVNVINDALGPMAGHYFVEKTFKGDSKDMAESIIDSLRTSFKKTLSNLEWLDKETRVNATAKVELLTQKIGFSIDSPDVRSPEALEDYFKNLTIDKADFFGNQIRVRAWTALRMLRDLDHPVDKNKWFMNPQAVDAYYNPSTNEIVFPAGILQQPFFHVDNPEYLNFGAIGVIAGHELTHAFDNEGRLYDAQGRLSDWWSNTTLHEFQRRSQCFINQYGNFTVKDPQGRENHVNGKLTLDENLADNGGLKKAFDAWQARFKSDLQGNKYKNHLLTGLGNYTRDQLFYMSFARVWCTQRRPASAIEGLRTEQHAPARWRVNGAVQNSEHFAQVFDCKPRSTMNPDTKCNLW
ncbi:hypothetical protein BGZ65_009561 [Modicella reniformis]|uniref:Uncharacterized protein n=1 Tax=Modicella reniformis TaxID=1440133 RepID=A0A9P6MAT3_9FUNG|nr:hypothetical protein BGZ65_009561 [Modicella reniformis]